MIYYPLSTLMLAGIRDILIISTPQDTPRFEQLLGDGSQWGINLHYAVQPSPDGLAQAFLIGARLRRQRPVAPWSSATTSSTATSWPTTCSAASAAGSGATVFAYRVHDPERYGVVEFDASGTRDQPRGKARRSRSRTTRSPASISTTTRWSTSPAT